jgi:glycosyltransferase involved in cell wall biosynthesis
MHLVYVIAPGGGPEANVKTLVPELEARGHAVSIIYTVPREKANADWPDSVQSYFAPPGSAHYYAAKLVRGYRAWPLRLRAWEQMIAVRRALKQIDREKPIDLVELTEGFPLSVLNAQWPVLVRAQGSAWTVRRFCDGEDKNDRWLISQQRRQLQQSHSFIALSNHLANHLRDTLQMPLSSISVIPYGIDTEKFRPSSNGAGNEAPIILTVGRLERRKGVDVLLRAMPQIWQRFPGARVHLVGGESDIQRRELKAMAPSDKQDQVVFPGFLTRDQLISEYQHATIYVAPTQYETFGYSILEAMSCGKPVVSTRVGAVPELVEDRQTGLLVNWDDSEALGDAILELLEKPLLAKRMGEQGRAKAKAWFSLDSIVERNLDLYRRASA